MFDTSTNTKNMQTVNAVSGILVKSHPKSYFMFGHVNSTNANLLTGKNTDRLILQAMLVGDKYLMYEVVDKDDYEPRGDA